MFENKVIMVTGGTGSFGRRFVQTILRDHRPSKVIVFSRDEMKQHQMQSNGFDDKRLRFFIGDVRDQERLRRAMEEVNIVVHAAALKQVPTCEYNPFEAVMTNIMGARNVINAALDCNVEKVVALSTDKAVNPVNLYGATKLVAEKLFVQGNSYRGRHGTKFSCVRYGNVVGSRGSVIPLFREQRKNGRVTVTDERMTRFWITLDQGVRLVLQAIERMEGGEVFVPKIPSMNIMDLVQAVSADAQVETIGIRPGEKIHEVLISEDEARNAYEFPDMFVIQPSSPWWEHRVLPGGRKVPAGFRYASDTNSWSLKADDLDRMVKELDDEERKPAPQAVPARTHNAR